MERARVLAWPGFGRWGTQRPVRTAAHDPASTQDRGDGSGPAALPPERLAAIRGEITRGNKIGAIKLMRKATGLGLAEAKQAVEAMGG